MNAFLILALCSLFALIAVPTIMFLFNAIPAIIDFFEGWIAWISYKED
jgi:hypothetical protein